MPINEDSPVGIGITNAYGRTKYFIEEILKDFYVSKGSASGWRITILRYFNPIGAHHSGRIGEDPSGIPNNLMPFVSQVLVGRRDCLTVFGSDFPTKDGTGVRDYIHVMDLAEGHKAALVHMDTMASGYNVFNLGTGVGVSVLELVHGMEAASGRSCKLLVGSRREGDVAESYADCSKAFQVMGWRATRSLRDCCEDTWRWQSLNPQGYNC